MKRGCSDKIRHSFYLLLNIYVQEESQREYVLFVFALMERWGVEVSVVVNEYQKYLDKNNYSDVLFQPLVMLVLARDVVVMKELSGDTCAIVFIEGGGWARLYVQQSQYLTVIRCFLGVLQHELVALGLVSVAYEHFVQLQKPRYTQSSKRSFGLFQFAGVPEKELIPYRTVNQSKWIAWKKTHSDITSSHPLEEFLISEKEWQEFEEFRYLEVVLQRQAIRIKLRSKADARKRIDELSHMLRFITERDELACCRYLDLSDNCLDDIDLVELCDSPIFKTVRCLVLSNNQITFEGLHNLLRGYPRPKGCLRYLILDRNYIWLDRRKTELLNRVLKKMGVVHLELSLNCISDLEIDGSEHFKLFQAEREEFLNDPSFWRISYLCSSPKIKSVINPQKHISKKWGLVGVVEAHSALHWRIAIEYIDNFSQRVLILADLVKIDEKVKVRFYFTTPQELSEKYIVQNSGKRQIEFFTREETGLLARILDSQDLEGFIDYDLVSKNCLDWIKKFSKNLILMLLFQWLRHFCLDVQLHKLFF